MIDLHKDNHVRALYFNTNKTKLCYSVHQFLAPLAEGQRAIVMSPQKLLTRFLAPLAEGQRAIVMAR